MKRLAVTSQTMDLALCGQVCNVCWLSAGLGLSMLQMLLLAQEWHLSRQALVPALLASAWALGSLAGTRFSGSGRLWGSGCLVGILLWLGRSLLNGWHIPHLLELPPALVDSMALALLAALLGACSAAWLAKPRARPAAGEKTALVRHLVGLTVGLLVAWMLPDFGGFLALVCCLPLLLLDAFLSGRAPLPRQGSIAARWMEWYWNMEGGPVQLERRRLLPSWRELFQSSGPEPARRTLWLVWLASGVAVVFGSVWAAVPTPFAASLQAMHTVDVLGWLLGGQLVALAVGVGCLLAVHNGIGLPGRLLPLSWQSRMRRLARLIPLAMAISLVALGTPALQTRWWLALSLAGYTLADAIWSILLPRLVPDLATVVQSQRHQFLEGRTRMTDPLHLTYARACEASAKRLLARMEGLAIVMGTPLLGYLIDRLGSVDAVLMLVGVAFALVLVCAALVGMLVTFTRRFAQARPAFHRRGSRFSGRAFPMLETAAHQ